MNEINIFIEFLKRNPFLLFLLLPLMLILLPIIAGLFAVMMEIFLSGIGIENRELRAFIAIGLVVILWTVPLIRNCIK